MSSAWHLSTARLLVAPKTLKPPKTQRQAKMHQGPVGLRLQLSREFCFSTRWKRTQISPSLTKNMFYGVNAVDNNYIFDESLIGSKLCGSQLGMGTPSQKKGIFGALTWTSGKTRGSHLNVRDC
eukprot:scaffold45270_cov37-Prasinocladus_malaysianus.AAC.1